jgi:hypothetical protein
MEVRGPKDKPRFIHARTLNLVERALLASRVRALIARKKRAVCWTADRVPPSKLSLHPYTISQMILDFRSRGARASRPLLSASRRRHFPTERRETRRPATETVALPENQPPKG